MKKEERLSEARLRSGSVVVMVKWKVSLSVILLSVGSISFARDVTFLVTSDTHYGLDAFSNNSPQDKACIDGMNAIAGTAYPASLGGTVNTPQGVAVVGDLTDAANSNDWNGYWFFGDIDGFIDDFGVNGEGRIDYPVFEGYGNHDTGDIVLNGIASRNNSRPVPLNVSSNGLHYSWDFGDVHLVQLNVYPGGAGDARDSLSFLSSDLAANVGTSRRAVILFYHYSVMNDWWTAEEKNAYYDVIKDYNVIAAFSGHSHIIQYSYWNGVNMWEDGTCQDQQYLVVHVLDDRIDVAVRDNNTWGSTWTCQVNTNNSPPVVNAGPDDSVTFAGSAVNYTLAGSVIDPEAQPVTSLWTATGPSTVVFNDPTSPTAVATFNAVGTYTLTLTADDGTNDPVNDSMIITVNPPKIVNVYNGAVAIVTNNIDDVIPDSKDPARILAINCGQVYYGWDIHTDAWHTGIWGGLQGDRVLTVNGIDFIADAASDHTDDVKQVVYNAIGSIDGGNSDPWWYMAGTDDGENPILDKVWIGTTGTDTNAAAGVSAYENYRDNTAIIITSNDDDTGSEDNFSKILRKTGTQNCGNPGERDITYVFDVFPGAVYNVKVIPYKNNGENSHTFITVDDVLILDDFQIQEDIESNQFIAVSYDVAAGASQTVLTVKVGTSTVANRRTGIQDVSAVILELIEAPEPPVVNAGADDSVALAAGDTVEYALQGSVVDPQAQLVTSLWTPTGPSTVVFNDPTSPTAVATFNAVGTYTLTLTADDGVNDPVSDSVVITVNVLKILPVLNGAVSIVTNNIDDVVNGNPDNTVALNCGQGFYTGTIPANAWTTGVWGSVHPDAELTVNGVTFIADMVNDNFEAARSITYAAVGSICGTNGGNWWWNAGSDDGLNPVLTVVNCHVTGNEGCGNQAVSPYDNYHDHNAIALAGADGTSVTNFSKILQKAGIQNSGSYSPATGMADRDMTYDFDVLPGWLYNVKVIPYKNNGEDTHTRVEVNDVLTLDGFQVKRDINSTTEFGVVSYDVITRQGQTTLQVVIGEAAVAYTGTGPFQGVQDVSAIIVEAIEEVDDLSPEADAGPDDLTWFDGGIAELVLQGSAVDPESEPLSYLWTAAGPGTVTFVNDEDPLTTAGFSAAGLYTLTLTASDAVWSDPDTVLITVYSDSCQAAKAQGIELNDGDINGDCETNIEDLTIVAEDWLESTSY